MKKILSYILFICLIISCKDINALNGSWVFIESKESFQETSMYNEVGAVSLNQIITFNDAKYHIYGSGIGLYPNKITGTISVENNKFIFNNTSPDKIKLNYKSSSFIEITKKDESGMSTINTYRKINDSLKNKSIDFSLINKKYLREFQTYTDTIHFLNDSVYTSSSWAHGNKKNRDNTYEYQRFQHNGFDILFTDIYSPFIIKKKIKDKLYISTFTKDKEDYIMTEIQNN